MQLDKILVTCYHILNMPFLIGNDMCLSRQYNHMRYFMATHLEFYSVCHVILGTHVECCFLLLLWVCNERHKHITIDGAIYTVNARAYLIFSIGTNCM